MSGGSAILPEIRAALEPHGIFARGVVNFQAAGEGPLLDEGGSASSVVLLGNIGGSIWSPFEDWRRLSENGDHSNPLDTWSKAVITPLAGHLGATAYFPSDPPWQPFQQWAMRAEGLKTSPLGILLHPEFGPWHGYRGALGFAIPIEHASARGEMAHPCDHCAGKPCLSACPVGAVTETDFLVGACRQHLPSSQGRAECMESGCLARNACPVGTRYRYHGEQLRFHMKALQSFP